MRLFVFDIYHTVGMKWAGHVGSIEGNMITPSPEGRAKSLEKML